MNNSCQVTEAARNRHRQYWQRAEAQLRENYHRNVSCFWRLLRKWRSPEENTVALSVRGADGVAVTNPAEVRVRWQEYFSGLLNPTGSAAAAEHDALHAVPNDFEDPVTADELLAAVKRLRCGKSAGADEKFPEMVKYAGDAGFTWFLRL